MAGAYLMLMFILFMITNPGESGLLGDKNYLLGILLFILTLPLSLVLLWLLDFLKETPLNILFDYLSPVILILSILFNAAIIYLVAGFVSKALQYVFTRYLK